jgi:signal transduction histidine kinase
MTHSSPLSTQFAPAERVSQEAVRHQSRYFSPLLAEFLNALPTVFLILNQQRQIVFANQALLDAMGLPDAETVMGMRPGEVLGCVHARDNDAGCGTTEFCRTCGAIQTILTSLRGRKTVSECRILQGDGTALDLRVTGTPFSSDGERFSLFVVEDISHEKRRQVFERLFFHDVLNLAGVLLGYTELLVGEDTHDESVARIKTILYQATLRLIDEVKNQRELSAAESGELTIQPVSLRSRKLLNEVVSFYAGHEAARDRHIQIEDQAQDVTFVSDPVLLERVLSNLLKNALEASQPGQTVTLTCRSDAEQVAFSVRNETAMPRDTQLQIFQRSFSTKGEGRGLGTYSVKLLTERYLAGAVTFASTPEMGTVFTVFYPLTMPTPP